MCVAAQPQRYILASVVYTPLGHASLGTPHSELVLNVSNLTDTFKHILISVLQLQINKIQVSVKVARCRTTGV